MSSGVSESVWRMSATLISREGATGFAFQVAHRRHDVLDHEPLATLDRRALERAVVDSGAVVGGVLLSLKEPPLALRHLPSRAQDDWDDGNPLDGRSVVASLERGVERLLQR